MVGVSCVSNFFESVEFFPLTLGSSFCEVGEDLDADDTLSRTVLIEEKFTG